MFESKKAKKQNKTKTENTLVRTNLKKSPARLREVIPKTVSFSSRSNCASSTAFNDYDGFRTASHTNAHGHGRGGHSHTHTHTLTRTRVEKNIRKNRRLPAFLDEKIKKTEDRRPVVPTDNRVSSTTLPGEYSTTC